MRNDALSRHYDKLTAEERFRLVLEAKARDDTAELERLKRTCPTKTYSMSDAAYGDRYEWSELLVLVVALDLTQYLAKLEVAGAYTWAAPQLLEASLSPIHSEPFLEALRGPALRRHRPTRRRRFRRGQRQASDRRENAVIALAERAVRSPSYAHRQPA